MVFTTQLLDSLPILGVFVAFAIVSMLFYEGGFKFGRWYQERTPGEQEGPTNLLVGSILGAGVPLIHMTGKGLVGGRIAGSNAVFFWVWTFLMLGLTSLFSLVLSARGLWSLRRTRDKTITE